MQKKTILWLLAGTVVAMVPEYLIRFKESAYLFSYNHFSTYPGDLWNFFANYLTQGLRYPPEYPAGLRFFYEIMGFYRYKNYTLFFTVNSLILATFAIGTTLLLYLILKKYSTGKQTISNLWYFWILAPSFLLYSTINYDLPVVFLIVLSVYLFFSEKYYGAVAALAVGMVIKVFPIFLLPVFIWKSPFKLRLKLTVLFVFIVVVLNLPYALMDFHAWLFPYIWQISSNLTTSPSQDTYWWILYPVTGKLSGWLSLFVFGLSYAFMWLKMKHAHFLNLCLMVILFFLLTDRIYSPQYNLYLLPFLVLATYPISKKLFYCIEVPNFLIVFFLFFLKDHSFYLQILVFVRYCALIALLIYNYKQSYTQSIIFHEAALAPTG
jgi:hypothetical protein